MRLIEFFDRGVALDPNRACLVDEAGSLSFREVQASSHRIARRMMELGVARGTKVAVISPNASSAFECVLGILRLGAVWVSINARNSIADNSYILDNQEVEVVFLASAFADYLPHLRANCPKIRTYICIDADDVPGLPSMRGWRDGPCEPIPAFAEDRNALATIFGSGGTTGRPKGVMHSNLTWETFISNFSIALPIRKPPVHLVVAPMTHAAGAAALWLLPHGGTQVIMTRFDAGAVLSNIEKYKVTHLFLPPTAIYMLLAEPNVRQFDYSSLECFMYASAPMSVDKLREALEVFGPVMAQTFGQVEAPSICTCLTPQDHVEALARHPERLLSCGRPSFLTPTEIMDDAGNLLPAGETGEIVARGNLLMLGYYNNPAATRDAITDDGWLRTGDIGRKDADGFVYIVDRKKDMIISGGFNVYPSEVEQVIWGHPAVQDCAVIGVPDEKWGEAVKAVVELRPGAEASEAEIISLCKQRLGGVMAPKTVEFWESLPRTPVGKVSKKDIRQKFWQGRERLI